MPIAEIKDDLSFGAKLILCVTCSLALTSTGLTMRKAEHQDSIRFSPIAATFFAECLKFMISICLSLRTPGSFEQLRCITWHHRILFAVPAVLYVLMNNIRFFLVELVNPGLLQVLWNLKIVTIALIYQCPPFSRKLNIWQWAGAALLVTGSGVADLSQWRSESSDGGSNSGGVAGLGLLALSLVVAGLAAVSCEFAYKGTAAELSFPAQGCLLYSMGAILNLATFVAWEAHSEAATPTGATFPSSLIRGFDLWAWLAVCNIAFTGFLVGLIFKYIDTIAQVRLRWHAIKPVKSLSLILPTNLSL